MAADRQIPQGQRARTGSVWDPAVPLLTGTQPNSPSRSADRPRILVVAHSGAWQGSLRALEPSCEISYVASCDVAAQLFSARTLDLLVVDVTVQAEEGLQLVGEIRQSSNVPLVCVAAESHELVRIAAYERGADDFLLKPISDREFSARIHGVLTNARRRLGREAPPAAAVTSTPVAADESPVLNVLQQLPDLIWIKDLDGRYVYANRATEKAVGRRADDLYGKTDFDIFPAATAEEYQINDRRALASQAGIVVVESMQYPDGTIHRSIVRKLPITDASGQVAYLGALALDITRQYWAEQHLNTVLDQIGDHLVCYDREWRFIYVNDKAAEVLGKSKTELIGSCVWDLFPDAVGNQYYHELHRALEEQTVIRSEHFDAPLNRWFENHIYPCSDGMAVFSSDITWRKQGEQSLKDADRRKDEFLAVLAHELRNPLAPVRNAVGILNLVGAMAPEAQHACAIIDRQVTHMTRLVDDLLDISRIARGKILLRKERCDLVQIVHDLADDYRSSFEVRGITLQVQCPSRSAFVMGDRTRLSQILGNVLHNASKFTDPGGAVYVQLTIEGREVVLSTQDTGIGMDPDVLERAFEVFSQASRALDRNRSGLGLGLALVRGLVQLHDGSVSAASGGEISGTKISIRLPLASSIQPERPTLATSDTIRSCRILVVEDNRDAAESLRMLLTLSGNQVEIAFNGVAALETAMRFHPDVVLCDIGLPGAMTGYDVANSLRQHPGMQEVFLVALTGYGQEEDQRRALSAGFDRHMTKPVDLDALQKVIASRPTRSRPDAT